MLRRRGCKVHCALRIVFKEVNAWAQPVVAVVAAVESGHMAGHEVVSGRDIAAVIGQQELAGVHLKALVSFPFLVSILALRKISNISSFGIEYGFTSGGLYGGGYTPSTAG